jgi:hypothetical protein
VGGREVKLEDLEESLDQRIEGLTKTVREMRRELY